MGLLGDAIRGFSVGVEVQNLAILLNVASAAKDSIQNGSPLTGSPGQPVDQDVLRQSWQVDFPTPTTAQISTNLDYALPNEEGVTEDGRPYIQRSPVGGRHSAELTTANIGNIVDDETAKVTGSR